MNDCAGVLKVIHFYGVSRCGAYTALDQTGTQIQKADLAFDESLKVNDTNSGGIASPAWGATDQNYILTDSYSSGANGQALPSESYTYVLQTITYHPTGTTVRINCIASLMSNITVTDLTSNPNPKASYHH